MGQFVERDFVSLPGLETVKAPPAPSPALGGEAPERQAFATFYGNE